MNFIFKKILKDQKGAMDQILVTLLLIIVGIGAVATLSTWMTTQTDALKTDANTTMQNIMNE